MGKLEYLSRFYVKLCQLYLFYGNGYSVWLVSVSLPHIVKQKAWKSTLQVTLIGHAKWEPGRLPRPTHLGFPCCITHVSILLPSPTISPSLHLSFIFAQTVLPLEGTLASATVLVHIADSYTGLAGAPFHPRPLTQGGVTQGHLEFSF